LNKLQDAVREFDRHLLAVTFPRAQTSLVCSLDRKQEEEEEEEEEVSSEIVGGRGGGEGQADGLSS
jgi:hypothetical protein